MTPRPIMDAGPGLNFFSLNKERLLFATVGPLAIPEIVEEEIFRRAKQEQRFKAADPVLRKLPDRLLEILSDDRTPELERAVSRIAGQPMQDRVRSRKDLGEIMVVAHAVVAAERGEHVKVLIDDGGGRRLAIREAKRLERLQQTKDGIGKISLISTVAILKKAAGSKHIPNKDSMRDLYKKLRRLDDGLLPLQDTGLMTLPCWIQSEGG